MVKKIKDTYTVNELAELLGITSWEEMEDKNPDAWSQEYSYAHRQALAEGASEEEAEKKALEAESEARDEAYSNWLRALESVASRYFEEHGMEVKPNKSHYKFKVVSNNWDNAANKVRETINGVGLFGFDSLKDFKDSIPTKSSRSVALDHLHWIKDWGSVYGEQSPSAMMEKISRRYR